MPSESSESRSSLPPAVRVLVCAALAAIVIVAVRLLDFRQPFIGYGLGGAFLIFAAIRPPAKRMAAVCALGAAVSTAVIWGHFDGIPTLLVQAMGAFGLASLFFLGCAIAWNGRVNEQASFRALLPGAVLTFLILGAVYSLNMASLLRPKTFDLFAYAFDGSLGFQPSFVLARFLNSTPLLFPFVKISYEGIVLAMAAIYAAFMVKRDKPVWEVIEFLFAPAMVGYLFFSVFPVCGPHYAFVLDFPKAYLPYSFLHRLALESIPVLPAFPRNGVPSLHLTWALMIWLNSRGLARWMRAVALTLLLCTVFDTLATGEHYLFDLVVSLPFALSMQACMCTVSFRQREKWLPSTAGFMMFVTWLVIGRYGIPWMLASRALPWSLIIVSSAISIAWAMRLPALIAEAETQPEEIPKALAATAAR